MRTHRPSAVLHALVAVGAAHAQPLERPDQPPAPPRRITPLSTPFGSVTDAVTIVQANVNSSGLNIVGDAANEPSLAIDPTAPNRIVIGWRQFDTIASNFRQAGYAWSNDGGRSWHFPGVLTPGNFRSDPALESDSAGNMYYYSLPDQAAGWHCQIFKSTDGGQTWAGPVEANGGDRAWFAIDKSGGIGDGNLYGIWNPSFGCCGSGSFGRDTSHGVSPWPAPVPGTPIWGTIAVGPDGEVYVAGMSGGSLRVTRSDNARNPAVVPTFSPQVTVNMGGSLATGVSSNPGGASGQTWVDVNRSTGPRRGHVYVASLIDPSGVDPADVRFARSVDGGLTWSASVRVNNDPLSASNIQWFVSMSVAPNGRIDITYNSTHESGNPNISRFYYTFSNDEGQTWSTPTVLTPPWDSTVGWPQQNKIGDYYDQESDDVGLFVAMAATMNGEQDVYFLRINDWDCNRNGIPDQQDLASGLLHDCDGNGIPDECEIAAGAKQDANHNGIPDVCECYADCNGDGVLGLADFGCFQTKFALQDPYADCNGDGVLGLADFGCFQTKFALGCP